MSMPPGPRGLDPLVRTIEWPKAWRIIATRWPPINLFERTSNNPEVWDALVEAEQLTNPRVRDEIGEIALVPPERRVSGPNASWVMAPFTHINPDGSRFSDGSFGVYYAAAALETAVIETAYHFARKAAESHDPPRREPMRVLLGTATCALHDIATLPNAESRACLDPDSYLASRLLRKRLREAGSDGVCYPSVRHHGGQCVGVFWPNVVGIPIQERHLQFEWNGKTTTRYFDYSSDEWHPIRA
jgi:RES domain